MFVIVKMVSEEGKPEDFVYEASLTEQNEDTGDFVWSDLSDGEIVTEMTDRVIQQVCAMFPDHKILSTTFQWSEETMPNWCQNILTVSGPIADVDNFMEKAQGEETALSLAALYPIPDDQKENWYDWCINHWGTKWDVDALITNRAVDEAKNHKAVTVRFSSAWSPPVELFSRAIEENWDGFESLHFHLAYAESGLCFVGEAYGDCMNGFTDWYDECHDWKDWAYQAESLGFVGEIESYQGYVLEFGEPEDVR